MRTLNLGILAHVDAGKTTLTERLLHSAGVIDEIGSVDAGTTQTDSLALERQRGITIKSAVVSFVVDDITINLIDTPGHPDFIAEVERVLSVLDGAVLVISAVEGVQSQTRILMRALQRLCIPTLIFVNKIDRGGARYQGVLKDIFEKLTSQIIAMGSILDSGTRDADFTPFDNIDAAFTSGLIELLANNDDEILEAYVNDEASLPYSRVYEEFASQVNRSLVHPVFFGSAFTGVGTNALITGLTELLPSFEHEVDAPMSGTVFKVERGASGEKIAYVRMFSGSIRARDRIRLRGDEEQKVNTIRVFEHGIDVQRPSIDAGHIAKLWGLSNARVGDAIGVQRSTAEGHQFAPPTLETPIVPIASDEKSVLHAALMQLSEQDPLINLRQDDNLQELYVSLYGEVQKEVIQQTLANDFGIDVEFLETTTICIERPISTGEAVEIIKKNDNPFLATIGIRVEPTAVGSGIQFQLDVEPRTIPIHIFRTAEGFREILEQEVQETLQEGLFGWRVDDCLITLIQSGYSPPLSTTRDFRYLIPLVLMSALKDAGTEVCEPIHHFQLEGPADALGPTIGVLARMQAVLQTPQMKGASFTLGGDIPATRMHEIQQQLRSTTRGEGVLEFTFDRYEPIDGTFPTRSRSPRNPLNRKEYLMHVSR